MAAVALELSAQNDPEGWHHRYLHLQREGRLVREDEARREHHYA